MPSTYTLNNGIELIATGEQSGTWGDTTNTNFQLIDTALDGQVTVTLASAGTSGSPNALAISDGSSSDGRNRMVIFNDGADLGATAYVQLTPNDAEKIVYIRNALSGSRSIIVFQGTYSASNDYEIPAGTTAVIYFNGGGAGAVAANVFNNAYFDSLRLGSVSVTAILDEDNMASDSATALATQQSIKAYVDAQVASIDTLSEVLANGNTTGANNIIVTAGQSITTDTISETTAAAGVTVDGVLLKDGGVTLTADAVFGDNDKAIFGAGSDLQIYHDGSNSFIDDQGTGGLVLLANQFVVKNAANTETLAVFNQNADVVLRYDNSQKFATTSTGIDVTGTITADGLTVDGSVVSINTASGNAVSSTGNFKIDIDSDNNNSSSTFTVTHDTATKTLFNVEETGDISFYEDTGTTPKFFWDASAEALILGATYASSDMLELRSGSAGQASGVRFANDAAADFRIFNNGSDALQFNIGTSTEAMRITSTGNVGIGTSSPAHKLHVADATTPEIIVEDTTNNVKAVLGADNSVGRIGTDTNHPVTFRTNDTERMRIDSSGNVGIGTTSPAEALHVSGSNATAFLDASTGTSYPTLKIGGSGTAQFSIDTDLAAPTTNGTLIRTQGGAYPLRFGTNTTERMRIDSSGNVLVGTTLTPTNLNATSTEEGMAIGGDGLVVIANSGQSPLVLNRLTSDGNILNFNKDGTTVGTIGSSAGNSIYMGTGDVGVRFSDVNDAIYPMTTGGVNRDAATDLGLSTVRFKDLYLSGGVYLGGTGSANLLDDYEEGTWTPADGSGAGLTFSNVVANYTKIGRQVFVQCELQYPTTSDTSDMDISGLPFAARDTFRFAGVMAYTTSVLAGSAQIINGTTTSIKFRQNGGATVLNNDELSGIICRFTMVYNTNA